MGLFDWITGKSRFKRFDDVFALNRESLWDALKQTLESQLHADKSIWLVAHFVETYTELQELLDQWQFDYDVVSTPIDPNHLERSGLLSRSSLKLVLGQLIPDAKPNLLEVDRSQTIALVMVERHPQVLHDQRIEAFSKTLPVRVELGYFLSLEDESVKLVVNETTLTILKQLGMNEHELITSHLVTSRLNKVLGRMSNSYRSDHPADSAEQWLAMNSPPD